MDSNGFSIYGGHRTTGSHNRITKVNSISGKTGGHRGGGNAKAGWDFGVKSGEGDLGAGLLFEEAVVNQGKCGSTCGERLVRGENQIVFLGRTVPLVFAQIEGHKSSIVSSENKVL